MSVGEFASEVMKYWYIVGGIVAVISAVVMITLARRHTRKSLTIKQRRVEAMVFDANRQALKLISMDDIAPGASTRLLNNKPILLLEVNHGN